MFSGFRFPHAACRCGLALLLIVPFAVSSRAETPVWPLAGPAFTAPVEEVQKNAARIAPENFMEATVFFERDSYRLDAAGRVTHRHQMIYRIENQAGVEGWSEISERWEPWHEKEPEIHARVIRADGTVSQLDQKTLTDGPASEQDQETYTDDRIRKAPLPGLAVGAIVEEESLVEDKTPFFSGGGIYRDFFSRPVPVVRSQLVVEAPKTLNLQYRVHLLPKVITTDQTDPDAGGLRHLSFDQEYLSAREDSDIHLPTHIYYVPMIEFSTGASWGAVASAYSSLAEPQIDPEKVKSLLPAGLSASDRLGSIQKILSRLHKDIRYTGIEFGQASLQPQTAAEIIKRHYGDCKDKAALLVALLRAAGFPANLALLDAGPGVDVTPELPGMNQFDHAIVYVPADGKGGEALWIDATAEYAQAGTLPSMDQGRSALIIPQNPSDQTATLTSTPVSRPEDDMLTEQRDVVMAEYGPAHITETSSTRGGIDETYRSDYGESETKEAKANLETYAKDEYLAKALTKVERGDARDFSKPFLLKLDMAEARRGNTAIDDAAIYIPFTGVFDRLPQWFRRDPKPNGEKFTPQQEEDQKKAVLARVAEYDVVPFVTEWRYRITPPAGFVLHALPEDKSTDMGPAKLTQHYESDGQGIVTAVLRFSAVKSRYTVDEALALREAVLAAYKQDMVGVLFDQEGAKLIAAGKVREALAIDKALIAKHPAEALHHAQMAYALLQAGLGDKARDEARQSVKLDSKSAVAYRALGWVCEFNEIGVQYSPGFDRECSQKSFIRAKDLDGDDINTRLNLALIEEYDNAGDRYGPGASLLDAIREYRELKDKDKPTANQYEDNLLFDLLYGHQFKELLQELDTLPSSVTRDALGIAATVAMQGGKPGIAAGIQRADHLATGAQERSSALTTAGGQLLNLRLYPEASEILSTGVEGQSNAAQVTQQIGIFRNLSAWNHDFLPDSDPRSIVQKMYMATVTGEISAKDAGAIFSRHAYAGDDEWNRNLEKLSQTIGLMHMLSAQSGLPAAVLTDVMAGNLKIAAEGEPRRGFIVSVQSLGSQGQQFFVSSDDGSFKVVTDGKTASEVGNELLYLLQSARNAEAASLLDWAREQTHKGGGDDPLSGPLLPRFWTSGSAGLNPPPSAVPAMQLAAAAELAYSPRIKELLPTIQAARDKETDAEKRTSLNLLLANGYTTVQNGPEARKVSEELFQANPESNVALNLVGGADALLKDFSDWEAKLDARLKKHPKDEDLLRMKANEAEWAGNFALSRSTMQQLIDDGKARASDYNMYAWTALFDGKVDADVVKYAQQANMLNKGSSFAELHTLASIYAVQGKTKEARETLLQAMKSASLSVPNSEVWYAFGSIYEQYGVADAAIEAYKKVEKPEGVIYPTSTYVLAQARLKALASNAPETH